MCAIVGKHCERLESRDDNKASGIEFRYIVHEDKLSMLSLVRLVFVKSTN